MIVIYDSRVVRVISCQVRNNDRWGFIRLATDNTHSRLVQTDCVKRSGIESFLTPCVFWMRKNRTTLLRKRMQITQVWTCHYSVSANINVWLASCLFLWIQLLLLCLIWSYLLDQIQTSQTGCKPYSDTPLQCDQMARWIFFIWLLSTSKDLPKSTKKIN